MKNERTTAALGSVLTALIDHRGRTPKKLGGNFSEAGIPVLSAKSIKDGRITFDQKLRFVTVEMHDQWMAEKLQVGDILLTSEAPLGEVAYLQENSNYCLGQRLFALRADPRKLESRFLYYLLRSSVVQHRLQARATGTTAQGIRQSELVKIQLEIPPVSEQRAIAHILGTLDDKIELNRRMNETLEAMARAIFKSWFVDFDPVHAKAEGRKPYGMAAETAAVFSDSFEETSFGRIPKGWQAVPLPEVVEINPTRPLSKGNDAPYLDMQNMPTRGHRPAGWINRTFVSGSRFKNGDTLLARITPCLENGKTAFVDFLPDSVTGWGSTEFIVLHPKRPLSPEYGYCLARSEDFREHAIQNMTGSSGRQRVPTDCFSRYLVVRPPERIALCFGERVRPLFEKVRANSEESATLTLIRDALLPKLISGEIRVNEVAM